MPTVLEQKREELALKQQRLAAVFAEAGPELDLKKITSISGTTEEKAAEIRRHNEELVALNTEITGLADLEKMAGSVREMGDRLNTPTNPMVHPTGKGKDGAVVEQKSLGELFVQSKAFREVAGGQSPVASVPDYDLKTLFQTSAGWTPEVIRSNRVELTPLRQLLVTDLPMLTETTQSAVKYMQETVFTNEASEIAEGGAFPEAELELDETSVLVRKIAVFLPITDEQLEDEPRARDYVNNRLAQMIRQRLDTQILNGDGSAPNIRGILNTSGIQTQALGGDTTLDAIHKAMTKVRHSGYSEPDAVVLHPNDWQAVRLTRTTDGLYIWGNPSETGPQQVWGIPVVVTNAISENTGLVGGFRQHSELAIRRGIEFKISDSHEGNFTQGIQAIRADFRVAVIVYRPTGFCSITGI